MYIYMSEEKQIFEEKLPEGSIAQPDEPINKKPKKKRQPMSEERKAKLRVQLEKARAVSLQNRKAKAKKKKIDKVIDDEVVGIINNRSDNEDAPEVIVKKPRKKNVRYVEETEEEMESRIEKRIREKMTKEKEKEEKERLRKKELDDLRSENALLKAEKDKKKEQKIKTEVTSNIQNPVPLRSKFSTFGRRRY